MSDLPTPFSLTDEELTVTLRTLEALAAHADLLTSGEPRYREIRGLAGRLVKAGRQQERHEARQRDRDLLDLTGIHSPTRQPSPSLPAAAVLSQPRACYVCNRPFTRVHFFYDSLCPDCADLNYQKRQATADLAGHIALITGARVKIGYHVALKLLRAGATVLATTRFPHDALRRYLGEPDFDAWKDRLTIHAIDLRHLAAVEHLTDYLGPQQPHLDILINNAAQTVRRPPAYYQHLLEDAQKNPHSLPADARRLLGYSPVEATALTAGILAEGPEREALWPALLSQLALVPGDEYRDLALFPPGVYDANGQQLDRRPDNSWNSKGENVSTCELVEVQAVNALAPFLLLARLQPLLRRSPFPLRHVVNVSAAEGQFRSGKTGKHPHTNMAKAALNMLTRTCAEDCAAQGICVNSVDTGWISNEAPLPVAERMEAGGFRLPLDVHDAAARVCDPIFSGVNTGEKVYGKYLKDYGEAAW